MTSTPGRSPRRRAPRGRWASRTLASRWRTSTASRSRIRASTRCSAIPYSGTSRTRAAPWSSCFRVCKPGGVIGVRDGLGMFNHLASIRIGGAPMPFSGIVSAVSAVSRMPDIGVRLKGLLRAAGFGRIKPTTYNEVYHEPVDLMMVEGWFRSILNGTLGQRAVEAGVVSRARADGVPREDAGLAGRSGRHQHRVLDRIPRLEALNDSSPPATDKQSHAGARLSRTARASRRGFVSNPLLNQPSTADRRSCASPARPFFWRTLASSVVARAPPSSRSGPGRPRSREGDSPRRRRAPRDPAPPA